jgi:hypothetical protein
MPTTLTLKPDEYVVISFPADDDTEEVHIVVDAERPVFAHVMDTPNLNLYREGEEFEYVGPTAARREHDFWAPIDHRGRWHLVISNEQDQPVAVHYDFPDD